MSTIASSELILNADGSVYHLHLLPEQLADTIITVGDPDRVAMVSKYFDYIEHKVQKREFITHTGFIGKKQISVISTGIGPDNIDIVFNELHVLKNYDFEQKQFKGNHTSLTIVRFGTSGCVQRDISVDSLLASEFGIGLDNVIYFYDFNNTIAELTLLSKFKTHCYFDGNINPYLFKADETLLSKLDNNFIKGITLTAPGFYAPQGRSLGYTLSHPEYYKKVETFNENNLRITNIEMETAAMYGLANVLNHRCLSLNVLLANRALGTFSNDPAKATDNLIQKGLNFISTL